MKMGQDTIEDVKKMIAELDSFRLMAGQQSIWILGHWTARYKKRSMNSKDELEEYYRLPLEGFDTCHPIQW
ncbi:hypothetical protein AZE42_13094 [Rhizopogon vesiculosus]|uniref:Uncharacterized protein n=1 Tax=Rhizopogon vesiculosus TaxID=180088 RepID=A0A1J8R5Q0_9AGAM|nr:hypothetical protein AZE42_13094 [Rhizopogon vesiculosus]